MIALLYMEVRAAIARCGLAARRAPRKSPSISATHDTSARDLPAFANEISGFSLHPDGKRFLTSIA
ncbi:MAG TPA: hypothetical protein VEU11_15915, partial [Terriglobales bacterium]|nr:hypothetical protein [Terriglobales bacterium]